jgi:hypothetical protein
MTSASKRIVIRLGRRLAAARAAPQSSLAAAVADRITTMLGDLAPPGACAFEVGFAAPEDRPSRFAFQIELDELTGFGPTCAAARYRLPPNPSSSAPTAMAATPAQTGTLTVSFCFTDSSTGPTFSAVVSLV